MAEDALERMRAIVARLPDVEQSDNPLGCYFLVRRKVFFQVATIVDPRGRPVTYVAWRPDPAEREALLALGHPYFSGRSHDRVGRIALVVDQATNWDEIAEFATDSYRRMAPKKLIAQLEADGGEPPVVLAPVVPPPAAEAKTLSVGRGVRKLVGQIEEWFGRDLEKFLGCFDPPVAVITGAGTRNLVDRTELEAMFEPLFASLAARGFERTTADTIEARALGDGLALLDAAFTRRRVDGTALEQVASLYACRRVDGAWRIVALIPRPPATPALLADTADE